MTNLILSTLSDPVRRYGFQDKTKKDLAVEQYLEGWNSLLEAQHENTFSQKEAYFARAFGCFRQALKTDGNYDCAKVALVLVGNILEELGAEAKGGTETRAAEELPVPDELEYIVSLTNHPLASQCEVLKDSWDFLQKLRSDQHTYQVFSSPPEDSLFEAIKKEILSSAEVEYVVQVQDFLRDYAEMELHTRLGTKLSVSLEGVVEKAPGYEDAQRIALKAYGEKIVPALSGILAKYNFKLV